MATNRRRQQNTGYTTREDGTAISLRGAYAEENGKFSEGRFRSFYHVAKRDFNVLLSLGLIRSEEWHHTGARFNRSDFYEWSDANEVDYSEVSLDGHFPEGSLAEKYFSNRKAVSALVKESESKPWEYVSENFGHFNIPSFEDYIKAAVEKSDVYSHENSLNYNLIRITGKGIEDYLSAEQKEERQSEHSSISLQGEAAGSAAFRRELHLDVDRKYNRIAIDSIPEDILHEAYENAYADDIKHNSEVEGKITEAHAKNTASDGKEKVLIRIAELMGVEHSDAERRAYNASMSNLAAAGYSWNAQKRQEYASQIDAVLADIEKKQKDYVKKLIKQGRAERRERIASLPQMFATEKEEMNGRYGWFDANSNYNLPRYYTGVEFKDRRGFNHYNDIKKNSLNIIEVLHDKRDYEIASGPSEEDIKRLRMQKSDATVSDVVSTKDAMLRDELIRRMRESGINVVTNERQAQRALERANNRVKFSGDAPKGVAANPVIYTSYNVDDVDALKEKYPSELSDKYYHHSTVKYGYQPLDTREGKKERLHIIGRLTTDKVDVLVVENPESDNRTPHITLATAKGIKPVASNFELEKYKDKIQPLDDYVDVTFTNNLRGDLSATRYQLRSDVKEFAEKYHLPYEVVDDYRRKMEEGVSPSQEYSAMRRTFKHRLYEETPQFTTDNFNEIFNPIKQELFEKFGNMDELEEKIIKERMARVGAMAAAMRSAEQALQEKANDADPLQPFRDMTDRELDIDYSLAHNRGDKERMRIIIDVMAERHGYSSSSDYQGTSAFNGAAPSSNAYFETEEERRSAWQNGEFEGDMSLADYIDSGIDITDLEWKLTDNGEYRRTDAMRRECIDALRQAVNGGSGKIKMYRSVPSSVKEGSFRNGDWITPSKLYAIDNAALHGWGDNFRIIEQEVAVSDVWWDGNDIAEWGYDDGNSYAYKNTLYNRKSLELETYDDYGYLIMPSRRFNENFNNVRFHLRTEEAPQETGVGYKVFVLKDGKLYPPMVANPDGKETPLGLWLDADAAPVLRTTESGRQKVKAGGKGTQGGSGELAYRPGWHLGTIPYALQFNRGEKIDNPLGQKNKKGETIKVGRYFPNNFVWAEVEYASGKSYQNEAMEYGKNEKGNFQHSLAGLPYLPKDGYYRYRTNPNPATDEWVITGAMRVKHILSRKEVADIVQKAGRQPQEIEEGDILTQEALDKLNDEIKVNSQGNKTSTRTSKRDNSVSAMLFEEAKNRFGITNDFREVGYILPDGSMLDFSGRHELEPGTDSSFLKGQRHTDHRQIEDLAYDFYDNPTGIETSMSDFLERGAIRVDFNAGTVNLFMKPTEEQKNVLYAFTASRDGNISVDYGNGEDSEHYSEYERVNPFAVFADIDRYFDNGIKTPGNIGMGSFNSGIHFHKVEEQPIFISNAMLALDKIKQEKATPEQWLKMLEKNGGIKAGEDRWTGLTEWLRSKNDIKGEQLKLILNSNPHDDSIGFEHTWIRQKEDIKTFEESFGEDYDIHESQTPDYTAEMISSALKSGKITVYSSHPIEDGAFVTPSKMEAQNYAGGGQVYSKEINLKDVAWIDPMQGQYAPVKSVSLTKSEIEDYLNENMIEVEEVRYQSESSYADSPSFKEFENEFNDIRNNIKTIRQERWEEADNIYASFMSEMQEKYGEDWAYMMNSQDAAKENILLENREQYSKEIEYDIDGAAFDEMVDRYGDDFSLAFDQYKGNLEISNPEYAAYFLELDKEIHSTREKLTTKGLDNNREIALTVPSVEPYIIGGYMGDIHFDDAGDGRAVAWVRFGETTNPDGERVLVIDEIQSKRHQDGREKGYGKSKEQLINEAAAAEQKRVELVNKHRGDWETYRNSEEYKAAMRDSQLASDLALRNTDAVPYAPFEKNWQELCMKRMLRYAAENGFDRVAWTTGLQQTERYAIGGTVNDIQSYDLKDKGQHIMVRMKDSQQIIFNIDENGTVSRSDNHGFVKEGQALSEIVGKALSDKIINREGKIVSPDWSIGENIKVREIEGKDLQIGGEGMKTFYDSILVKFTDKYTKQWGVKTEDVLLPELTDEEDNKGVTMHSVPVTEQMRSDVMQGQPMFFKTKAGTAYGFALDGKIFVDTKIATAETPIHEYTHLWAEVLREQNPREWKNIVSLMKGAPEIWDKVVKQYPELHSDDEIADEVLAQYSGKRGYEKLMQMHSDGEVSKGALDTLMQALEKLWKKVAEFFRIHYTSKEEVADRVLRDLLSGVNPRQEVEKYLKRQDKQYMKAVERGDEKKVQEIFQKSLRFAIGNGMTPYIAVDGYRGKLRGLAHRVKTMDKTAINTAADKMAPLIPRNAVLVPAPSHKGEATDMLKLAKAISRRRHVEVMDVLKSYERERQYTSKKFGGKAISSDNMGIVAIKDIPEGKIPVVIDNVVSTGNTAEACVKALGYGIVVSLADATTAYKHTASLKNAAPIMRNQAGEVIPLSKRFDLSGAKYIGHAAALQKVDSEVSLDFSNTREKSNSPVQGLEGYTQDEIEDIVESYVQDILDESDIDATIEKVTVIGSRSRNEAKADSDLDILLEYSGEDYPEDAMYNLLHDDENPLEIEGLKVDINPINPHYSLSTEEWLARDARWREEDKKKVTNNKNTQNMKDSFNTAKLQEQAVRMFGKNFMFDLTNFSKQDPHRAGHLSVMEKLEGKYIDSFADKVEIKDGILALYSTERSRYINLEALDTSELYRISNTLDEIKAFNSKLSQEFDKILDDNKEVLERLKNSPVNHSKDAKPYIIHVGTDDRGIVEGEFHVQFTDDNIKLNFDDISKYLKENRGTMRLMDGKPWFDFYDKGSAEKFAEQITSIGKNITNTINSKEMEKQSEKQIAKEPMKKIEVLRWAMNHIGANHGSKALEINFEPAYYGITIGNNVPALADVQKMCDDLGISRESVQSKGHTIRVQLPKDWPDTIGQEQYIPTGNEMWKRANKEIGSHLGYFVEGYDPGYERGVGKTVFFDDLQKAKNFCDKESQRAKTGVWHEVYEVAHETGTPALYVSSWDNKENKVIDITSDVYKYEESNDKNLNDSILRPDLIKRVGELGIDYTPVGLSKGINIEVENEDGEKKPMTVKFASVSDKNVMLFANVYDVFDDSKGVSIDELPEYKKATIFESLRATLANGGEKQIVIVQDKADVPSYALPAIINGDFSGIDNEQDEKDIRDFMDKNAGCIYDIQPGSEGFIPFPAFGKGADCETVFIVKPTTPEKLLEEKTTQNVAQKSNEKLSESEVLKGKATVSPDGEVVSLTNDKGEKEDFRHVHGWTHTDPALLYSNTRVDVYFYDTEKKTIENIDNEAGIDAYEDRKGIFLVRDGEYEEAYRQLVEHDREVDRTNAKQDTTAISDTEKKLIHAVSYTGIGGKEFKFQDPVKFAGDANVTSLIDGISVSEEKVITLHCRNIDQAGATASFALTGREDYSLKDLKVALEAVTEQNIKADLHAFQAKHNEAPLYVSVGVLFNGEKTGEQQIIKLSDDIDERDDAKVFFNVDGIDGFINLAKEDNGEDFKIINPHLPHSYEFYPASLFLDETVKKGAEIKDYGMSLDEKESHLVNIFGYNKDYHLSDPVMYASDNGGHRAYVRAISIDDAGNITLKASSKDYSDSQRKDFILSPKDKDYTLSLAAAYQSVREDIAVKVSELENKAKEKFGKDFEFDYWNEDQVGTKVSRPDLGNMPDTILIDKISIKDGKLELISDDMGGAIDMSRMSFNDIEKISVSLDEVKTFIKQQEKENSKTLASVIPTNELVEQFTNLKKKHPDAMLLFRTGDFYEVYMDDAVEASEVLGITLTKHNKMELDGKPLWMAAFPHHALDTYLPKLIRTGHRVAICDQLFNREKLQKQAKGRITETVGQSQELSKEPAAKQVEKSEQEQVKDNEVESTALFKDKKIWNLVIISPAGEDKLRQVVVPSPEDIDAFFKEAKGKTKDEVESLRDALGEKYLAKIADGSVTPIESRRISTDEKPSYVKQYAELMVAKIREMKEAQDKGDKNGWKKPWIGISGVPRSIYGNAYVGANNFLLSLYSEKMGYKVPVFATHSRFDDLNFTTDKRGKKHPATDKNGNILPKVHILKGEHSFPVWFTNVSFVNKETKEKISYKEYRQLSKEEREAYEIKRVKGRHNVFCVEQTNLKDARPELYKKLSEPYTMRDVTKQGQAIDFTPVDLMVSEDLWICPINIKEGSDRAFFRPGDNTITLPAKTQFFKDEDYYSTMFHEMGHSTGIGPLHNRDFGGEFGSPKYAKEELVAELTAAIVASQQGMSKEIKEESAKYLSSWLDAIEADPEFLMNVLHDVDKASATINLRIADIQEQLSKGIGADYSEIREMNNDLRSRYAPGLVIAAAEPAPESELTVEEEEALTQEESQTQEPEAEEQRGKGLKM